MASPPSSTPQPTLPGTGHGPHLQAPNRRRTFHEDRLRAFEEAGKPIAAVCHGPQLLIAAPLVKGRTLTAWKTIQDDLEQIGAKVKDEPVVRDRNWITSRKPEDLKMFSDALVEALEGPGEDERRASTSQPSAHP